jgi:hypothetical protein
VWCVGEEGGDEVRFDLTGAMSIESANCDGVPDGFESFTNVMNESLSIVWTDGTRLHLMTENAAINQRRAS